jgi:hypothetical protein
VVLVIVSVLCNDEKGGLEKIINCMIEWFKKEKHDCGSKKRSVLAGRYYSNALCLSAHARTIFDFHRQSDE